MYYCIHCGGVEYQCCMQCALCTEGLFLDEMVVFHDMNNWLIQPSNHTA